MNNTPSKVLITLTSLLLTSAAPHALGCGQSAATLVELPFPAGSSWHATALNATNQMTGYVSPAGATEQHAFFYDGRAIVDLPTLGGSYGQGFVLNASGQVAGESTVSGDVATDTFLWSGGALTDLGALGGFWSHPAAINDSGQVAGLLWTPSWTLIGYLYADGFMQSLGTLGGEQSYATAINRAGVVVGGADLADGETHAFSFSGGAMTDLGTFGGGYSSASAVNNAGVIVGDSWLPNGESHGFIYAGGTMTDVGTLGGSTSSCLAINDRGEVIGTATTPAEITHAFLYSGGVMTDLGTLGGSSSAPSAINNLGQIVGQSITTNGALHAFLWQKGALVDLNSLLPTNSGWELQSGDMINDLGRIAGAGSRNGADQMFILNLGSANHPPVAIAGADQTVDCRAQVTLDGTSSTDPDGDALAYEWSAAGYVLGTNATLSGGFALGTNVVTLKVTDPCGDSSQAVVVVRVVDTHPPSLICPGPITASADANGQAAVPEVLSRVVATDDCTPPEALVLSQEPAAGTLVGLGPHAITVTAKDPSGNIATASVLLTVADTTAPVIQSLTATPNVLSPPNHKLMPVTLSVLATDNCDGAPVSKIVSITANQATDPGDIQVTGNLTASLAASRNPGEGGRIYTLTVQAMDASGNTTTSTVQVTVPQGGQPVTPKGQKH
jgi:probable HAF family extracellular repeat protein/YD repeat-containing protein